MIKSLFMYRLLPHRHIARASISACLTLAVLSLSASVRAQEEKAIEIQFVAFPKSADPTPVEIMTGEGKSVEVELTTNNLSKAYTVPRLSEWILGKSGKDADGKPTFEVFGRAKSISSEKQLILVVRKGPSESDGFELIPLDSRTAGFGGGKYLFMNAAQVPIGGFIGDKKFALKPGGYEIVSPKASASHGNHEVCFIKMVYQDSKSEASPFFSSEWRHNKQVRTMTFIYHDPTSKRLRMHVIRDAL